MWIPLRAARRGTSEPTTVKEGAWIDDALHARRGVCQDFAHILIALGRQIGVPCRYVSGYLFQQPDAVEDEGVGAFLLPPARHLTSLIPSPESDVCLG